MLVHPQHSSRFSSGIGESDSQFFNVPWSGRVIHQLRSNIVLLGCTLSVFGLESASGQSISLEKAHNKDTPCEIAFHVPPIAKLYVQGQEQNRISDPYKITSPPLDPKKDYVYSVKAVWTENGKERKIEREVRVRAGQKRIVNLYGNSLQEIVQEVVTESNRERSVNGAKPLLVNKLLNASAQKHAENMAKQRKLSHSLDNQDFLQRSEKEGYKFASGGENIAEGASSSTDVVGMWMRSPGHRRNLLSHDYTEIGIGTAWDSLGRRYDVQVFGFPQAILPSPIETPDPISK